jgi:hypothetical protein
VGNDAAGAVPRATYVSQNQFDPESFIAAIENEGVTHMMLVLHKSFSLLNSDGFAAERLGQSKPFARWVRRSIVSSKKALTRVVPDRFYELYGLTEGFITILDKNDYPAITRFGGRADPFL